MADTTSQILIKLLSTGDLSALTKGKEQSEELRVSLEALRSTMGLLGGALSLGALAEGTRAMLEYGASIQHLSEQAGISTEAFQTLSYAAVGAGLKQDELGQALNVLQRNMAQAADGATKQNRAIKDLGLNTAELLAMPVEQQIQAIARAYVTASDKGKAWADVTALLGRNSARLKEVLNEIGDKGLAGIDVGKVISDADIQRLEEGERAFSKMWMSIKAAGAGAVADLARFGDAVNKFQFFDYKKKEQEDFIKNGKPGAGDFHGDGTGKVSDDDWDPKVHAAKVAAIQAELDATIQGSPQMIAAHQALSKAIADEGKAYESATDAAKRLRAEASADEEKAAALAANKTDAGAQLESVKLQTEAAKLRTQANAEDAKSAKEIAQYAAAEAEMSQRRTQEATKLLPINQQLSAAGAHKLEIEQAMAALDPRSLTYQQDHLKLEGQILAVDTQISALKEKDAMAYVEGMAKDHELADKREAIALAAVEHDYNLTDTQKWDEKRAILVNAVSEQEQYIQNMQTIAASSNVPQGARDKAGQLAGSGENTLASTRSALADMGPNPTSFVANFRKDLGDLQKQWGTLQQNMAHGLTSVIAGGFSSVSRELTKAITGAETLGQAFQNVAIDIGETLVQALVDMGVQWIATEAMKLAFGTTAKAADTATTVVAAEAASLAWAVPAALASVASFGAADIAGMAGLSAAVAEAATLGAVGFADGGYTGGIEGNPAGIVHGNEFVWSAPAVRAVGVGNLERAHQAALSGGGGASAGGGASGRASGNIILAMSPEDVAKSQRAHVDARVVRMAGMMPAARYAI